MRRIVLTTLAVLAFIPVASAWAQPGAPSFQGYWMGIDPVDGGDSRRSIIQQPDGTFNLIGRDTVLTLCDDTDRGVATFADGVRTGRDRMASDNLRIHCFNTNAEVTIKAAYRLLDAGTMIEELTLPNGVPFATIVFHRASANSQPPARLFQGYWMGVDPVDGGDARRSFLAQSRETYSMIGRDTCSRSATTPIAASRRSTMGWRPAEPGCRRRRSPFNASTTAQPSSSSRGSRSSMRTP